MSRRTSGRAVHALRERYRMAARAGDWAACSLVVAELYRNGLEGHELAELIYADGCAREQRDDTYNARRCYELAASKGHANAQRRLVALGGALPPVPPVRH
jgi:TPR repeat protein